MKNKLKEKREQLGGCQWQGVEAKKWGRWSKDASFQL